MSASLAAFRSGLVGNCRSRAESRQNFIGGLFAKLGGNGQTAAMGNGRYGSEIFHRRRERFEDDSENARSLVFFKFAAAIGFIEFDCARNF